MQGYKRIFQFNCSLNNVPGMKKSRFSWFSAASQSSVRIQKSKNFFETLENLSWKFVFEYYRMGG